MTTIDITEIIGAAITLIFACIGGILIPLIRRFVSAEKLASLRVWVSIAVVAAEQLTTGISGNGSNKKAWVREFLAGRGVIYDQAALDALIEAEVWKLKNKEE